MNLTLADLRDACNDPEVEENNVSVIRRRFPGFCPHHIVHNLGFLSLEQQPSCTARPFSGDACAHGSHAVPEGFAGTIRLPPTALAKPLCI